MTEPWLQRHLEARGLWNPDSISRAVRAATCRDCRAQVLRGLDADRAATTAEVDPHPLDPVGEALALLTGCRTYDLWRAGNHYELEGPRDASRIRFAPAGSRNTDVLASHCCGQMPLPAAPSVFQRRYTTTATDAPCPF